MEKPRSMKRFEMLKIPVVVAALLCLVVAACATPPGGDRPERTRTGARESLYPRETLPGAPREAPTLEDLFGRFSEEEIRIAILLPLSGPNEALGNAFLDSAAMALFEAYDPRLGLFPFDTLGSPEGARRAVNDAIASGADIILGPVFSEAIAAAAPAARAEGIRIIGFSNNTAVAGGGVYLLSFLPEEEVRRVIAFAATRGHERFGALIPDSPYGETVLDAFARAVYAGGGEIAALEIYERDPSLFEQPVRRLANYAERREAYLAEERFLKSFKDDDLVNEILERMKTFETVGDPPFDAVIVPESGQMLRSLIPLLPYYDIDPEEAQFLGTGVWYDPTLPGEPTLEGAWFAGADPEKIEDFMERFRSLYNYRPPRIATLAFDAVGLAASLSRIELKQLRFADSTLQNANGFSGIDGIFRFRPDGTPERGFAILEIGREGFRVIDPAPRSFRELR